MNITSNTGTVSRSVTTTDLNAKLRRYLEKGQSPPKPGYGVSHVVAHRKGHKGKLGASTGLSSFGGIDRAQSAAGPPAASLATLATTYIPPMKRSSTTSLLAGRGTSLADNVGQDKQEEIARELQSRLLKTRWVFPT